MQPPSCLSGSNAAFLEDLYEAFLSDPTNVSAEWQRYFEAMIDASQAPRDVPHGPVRQRMRNHGAHPHVSSSAVDDGKQVAVLQLINAYRFIGHRQARLDPLNQHPRPHVAELDPAFHGLNTRSKSVV